MPSASDPLRRAIDLLWRLRWRDAVNLVKVIPPIAANSFPLFQNLWTWR